jgi:hypothetical protein
MISSVHFALVTDAEDEDDEFLVLDFADDAVVAHPVAPVVSEFGTLKSLAQATRIFEFRDALVQELR